MRNITILTLGLALGAGGCAAGPDYRAPGQAALGVPEQYYQAPGNAITDAELANWWTQLGDPTLNTLIEKAIAANLD
ncbi:MAG TPA: RND transporter, partial [Rhizorhapis sp.]|nr:RND transporter [Rhizorhapis sp.]